MQNESKKCHVWGSCFSKDRGRICSKYAQRRWCVLRWVNMFYLQPWQLHKLLIPIICFGLVVGELLSRRSCWKLSRAAANLSSGTRRWQFADCAQQYVHLQHLMPNSCFQIIIQRRNKNKDLWRWGHITSRISSLILQLVPVGLYKTTQRNPIL